MKHSIIMRVNDNLIYQCSMHEKPRPESTSSPVEYNRALPEWEQTSNAYLIKKEDEAKFIECAGENANLTQGAPFPHNMVLIVPMPDKPEKKWATWGNGVKQPEVNANANGNVNTQTVSQTGFGYLLANEIAEKIVSKALETCLNKVVELEKAINKCVFQMKYINETEFKETTVNLIAELELLITKPTEIVE